MTRPSCNEMICSSLMWLWLLLPQHYGAFVQAATPDCRNYHTELTCAAAKCVWRPPRDPPCLSLTIFERVEPTPSPTPAPTPIDNSGASLPAAEEKQGCLGDAQECQTSNDCCVGLVCGSLPESEISTPSSTQKLTSQVCISPELAPATLSCPAVGKTKDLVPDRQYRIRNSNHLCTLTKVTTDAKGDVAKVIPMARSFHDFDWQVAAGEFASSKLNDIVCNNGVCSLHLPPLHKKDKRSGYRLSSHAHSLSFEGQRARFLEMTTFGTTRKDMTDNWTFQGQSEWLQHQIQDIPMTSHREYFRKRANPRWTFSQKVGRSDHPCDANSRWRRFTFTRKDKYQMDGAASGYLYVQNTTYTTTPNGKDIPKGPYILYIDGHARTLVETWEWKNPEIHERFPHWDGNYAHQFCSSPEEWTGGRAYFQTKPFPGRPNGECREITSDTGNPAINFTNHEGLMGPYVLNLPNRPMDVIDEWKNGADTSDRLLLPRALQDDLCASIPSQAEDFARPVFGMHPTQGLLQWDPRLVLKENTLENPLADGGGATEEATGGKTYCSNVPRTFSNFDSCVFSTEPTACGSFSVPDTPIELDSNNLLQLHALTGRYVYAIHGLKVKQDEFNYEIEHPCTRGLRSRWEREPGTTCDFPTPMRQQTKKTLRRLIATSSDDNPFLRDVTFPRTGQCDPRDVNVEIEIQVGDDCWKHVHPESLSVWDLTYWTQSHPGNANAEAAGRPNPITKWLDGGLPVLVYPSAHPMDGSFNHTMSRWDNNFGKFEYVGRFGDMVNYRDLPANLKTQQVAEYYGVKTGEEGSGVIVCGSPGEVANDETEGSLFDVSSHFFRDTTVRGYFSRQRETVWTMIALYGRDQLRQRMAWALSQILVIAKPSINLEGRDTEIFLAFYDIFVRNAFGNYLDILREISYSPLMAENLSYLNSKSSAYIWEKFVRVEFADENFAREIMQLFTTGLVLLNLDGTPKLDANNKTQEVYTNDHIRSFSRAWTGFSSQPQRGNYEDIDNSNRLDPMKITPEWRDRFPKTDLLGGYIGDQYPLCVDLPAKQFLRKGATYRFLGRSPLPELQEDNSQFTDRFVLNDKSDLFAELCDDRGNGCRFPNQVTLESNLRCNNLECDVDIVRVVEVARGMFYEYMQPPCVEHPFFENAMKLNRATMRKEPICGNPLLPVATSACCETPDANSDAISSTLYQIERMTFATQKERCASLGRYSCEYRSVDKNDEYWKNDIVYHWAKTPCSIQVKVNPQGEASVVHNVPIQSESKVLHVNDDTRNYFGVAWKDGLFPEASAGNCGVCQRVENENCLCETSMKARVVFDEDPSGPGSILQNLHIGAPDPSSFDDGTYSSTSVNGFVVHKTGTAYNLDTIFEVEDDKGQTHFLKNAESTVHLENTGGTHAGFSFRNPVHFMSLIPSETNARDAIHETEATLKHYFYHDNTAPFLCFRFLQRFGVSNPSPRYVKQCSYAFRSGTYRSGDVTFGTGDYGDLAATVASVVLDREAWAVELDADPSHGSIREPLMRVIGLMRSMEYKPSPGRKKGETPLAVFKNLDEFVGQMAHEYKSVFSFFLPEFQPEGPLSAASLVAPEAQLMDMPKTIDMINGLHGLIKYGLSFCFFSLGSTVQFGFGKLPDPVVGYGRCADNGRYNRATGMLTYQPSSDNPEEIIDELATLLTSGRLSPQSRKVIVAAFESAVKQEDAAAGLRIAQQLITTTPEFHTTNLVKLSGDSLTPLAPPPVSDKKYKAIVFLMLAGGCDSFNMLVPNECSAEDRPVDAYTHYAEMRNPAHLLRENLLPIDGSGQVDCDTFGVHEDLPVVQELYEDGDLLFFANTGVIGRPSTKKDFPQNTPTQLFAHNTMQYETRAVDLFDKSAGAGVLGRLTDALRNYDINTGSISLDKSSSMLAGEPGVSPTPYVINQNGVRQFMPQDASTMTKSQMLRAMHDLNNATRADSGFMAKTWSSSLAQSLFQNEELYAALKGTEVDADFGDTELGKKFEIVTKMIKTRDTRGSDLDVFYVEIDGFDTHADVEENLKLRFNEVNSGLSALVEELKAIELWDNVVVMQASEFARTLSSNSGAGTDHAWGGNYFMTGGSVKGGKILGKYPSNMSETSPINVGRGRFIPTTAWDQIWPGIAQWTGVKEARDFDDICPNRGSFDWVFKASNFFTNAPTGEIPISIPIPEEGETESPEEGPVEIPVATPRPTEAPAEGPSESPGEETPGETPSETPGSVASTRFAISVCCYLALSSVVAFLLS